MLSVSMISSGARAVAASMMSPEKNACRVKCSANNWYRYDPYMSKVMPSPMKTQLVSPVKSSPTAGPAPCDEVNEATGLHRNSLFNTPAPQQPMPMMPMMSEPEYQYQQYENQQQQQQEYYQQPQQQYYPQQPMAVDEPCMQMQEPVPVAVAAPVRTESSSKTHYAVVHFKHDSATFIAPFRIASGDNVIVEGDRGVDIGVVSDITTVTPAYPVPLKIVRRATAKDMEAFNQKKRKEQVVQNQVQELANELSLGVQIVDTEFQFDNNKLTVFFDGKKQIDFRKLQRSLFREHRCRIWLSNMAEVEYNAKLQKVRRTR